MSFGRKALRRLLLAVPTLGGISLVTFAVVHLIPAHPGASASIHRTPLDEEAADARRRTYGFDLPAFLNFDIQDRTRRVARALRGLRERKSASQAERRLVRLSTLALPGVLRRLGARSVRGAEAARLRRVAAAILERMQEPARARYARAGRAGYAEFWQRNQRRLRFGAAKHAVDRLVGRGGPSPVREVQWMHQLAVPRLIERLLDSRTPGVARARLARALGRITGHVVVYDPRAGRREREAALAAWRDFWRGEELVYRDLSGWERFTGVVTRTRYARWLGRIVRGDFGHSTLHRRPVWDVIAERLPVTLGLSFAALLLAYLLAVPLGVWSARRRGELVDRAVTGFLFALYAMPPFWVALLAILFLGGIEGPNLFPAGGLRSIDPARYPLGSGFLDLVWHAILPVGCLAYGAVAIISRYQRAGMIDVLGQDYIRTARAKGLPERRVVWRHGVPNGIIPVISLLGVQIPYLISGSVIIETVFDIPGMGLLTLRALLAGDPNLLMGIITLTALLTLVGLLVADLLMLWVDPRIDLARRPR